LFEIWINKSDTFISKSILIQFTGFGNSSPKAGSDIIEKEGNRNFTVDTNSNEMVTYDINQTIMVENCNITITKLEISPLSYCIYFEETGVRALEEATGEYIDQAGTLTSLLITGIEYQDGSMIPEHVHEMSWGFEDDSSQGKFQRLLIQIS